MCPVAPALVHQAVLRRRESRPALGDVALCTCRVAAVLTSIRAVNKTDSATMGANFGTMGAMFKSTEAQLSAVPGLGPTKVKRLHAAFSTPFLRAHHSQTPAGAEQVGASGAEASASGDEGRSDSDYDGGEARGSGVGLTDEQREWLATQEALVDTNLEDDADDDDDFA